jgi:hypothetical protein
MPKRRTRSANNPNTAMVITTHARGVARIRFAAAGPETLRNIGSVGTTPKNVPSMVCDFLFGLIFDVQPNKRQDGNERECCHPAENCPCLISRSVVGSHVRLPRSRAETGCNYFFIKHLATPHWLETLQVSRRQSERLSIYRTFARTQTCSIVKHRYSSPIS